MDIVNQSTLLYFLQTVRPAQSLGEQQYFDELCDIVKSLGFEEKMKIDSYGNLIINLLDDKPSKSRVMFTSHTDSVHIINSKQNIIHQKLVYTDESKQFVQSIANDDYTPNCLGADDATGNYIMLRLIQAKIPALYVFFRDEEIGGLGSDFFSNQARKENTLSDITHCISFDRKGYDSIITHQFSGRTASDEFAKELAELIKIADKSHTLDFKKDDGGSFTDSANFTHLISECTNLSVGYFNQHTQSEYQDVHFVEVLVNALIGIDWENLSHYREIYDYTKDYYDYDDEIDEVTDFMVLCQNLSLDEIEQEVLANPKLTSKVIYFYSR